MLVGEAIIVPLPNLEMLEERHIPVLLERSVVDIAAEIAESGYAEVGIDCAVGGIKHRSRRKRSGVEISVDKPVLKAATSKPARYGRTLSETCSEQRRAPRSKERSPRRRIVNRER